MSRLYKSQNYYSNKYSQQLKNIFATVCFMRKEELRLEKKAVKEIKKRNLNKNKWGNREEMDELFEELVNQKNINSKDKFDLYNELIGIRIPNKREFISNEFNKYVMSKQGKVCQDEFLSKRNNDRTYDNLVTYLRLGKKRYENIKK